MRKKEKTIEKNSKKTLGLMIIFGAAFVVLGCVVGFYLGTILADTEDNITNDVKEEKEEETLEEKKEDEINIS